MDFYLFEQINQFAGKWAFLDNLGIFMAEYSGYFLILLLLNFLFLRNKKKYSIMIFQAFVAGVLARLVITNIIRTIYYRPRPFIDHQVNLLLEHSAEGSFPSGHAAFFFAISAIVYFFNKKAGIFFFVISFLMGIARVFVGIHYPRDILAGIFVGVFSAWLVNKYLKKVITKLLRKKLDEIKE
jgi:undecaprenyl-diphosphatase